jgi:hypothetical protein
MIIIMIINHQQQQHHHHHHLCISIHVPVTLSHGKHLYSMGTNETQWQPVAASAVPHLGS